MKKILGAVLLAGFALVGCGGGGDDSGDVFSEYSKTYECYTVTGSYSGQYAIAFSAGSVTVTTGGVNVSAAAAGNTAKGGYQYVSPVPSGRRFAVILEPSTPPFVVSFAFSNIANTDIDQSTFRICR